MSTNPSVATTLDGRLLCASDTAYGIQPDGSFDPQPIYVTGAGFGTSTIQTFVAGVGGTNIDIDACILSTNQDGVILAFRGTLPPSTSDPTSFFDWANDFYAEPKTVAGIPGQVHSGFWDALDALWPTLLPAVQTAVASGSNLYITGHSKGGSLASLAAMRLLKENNITAAEVHTFAAAHPGDTTFVDAFNSLFTCTRWEYQDDIVPHLPPNQETMQLLSAIPWIGKYISKWTGWDYDSAGTLNFIDWSDQIVTVTNPPDLSLDAQRVLHLTTLFVELKLSQIAGDHGAYCGQGYMSVIVPGNTVCPAATPDLVASIVARGMKVTMPSDAVRTSVDE